MTGRSRGTTAQSLELEFALRAGRVITESVERVFASVNEIHRVTIDLHRAASTRGEHMGDSEVGAIRNKVLEWLTGVGQIAVGMGLVVTPGLIRGPELRMEWWQQDSVRDVPAWLDVDLKPASIDYYDYLNADWYTVPRDAGRRHVVGPYVDVHGTGRYILTFTTPVIDGDEFLGVAGADVPVARFDTHVLRQLGSSSGDILVTNDEGRVVLSTSPRWLTGALVEFGRAGAQEYPNAITAEHLAWHLHVVRF